MKKKITTEEIEIVSKNYNNMSLSEIAKLLGCSYHRIQNIVRRIENRKIRYYDGLCPKCRKNEKAKDLPYCMPCLVENHRKWKAKKTGMRPRLRGEINPRDEEIRALRKQGMTLQKIGELYNLTKERIRQIVNSFTY